MRLLSLCSLRCHAKDITIGYPLKLEILEMQVKESEYNRSFILNILPTINWKCILICANAVGLLGIPNEFSSQLVQDEEFIKAMHYLLCDVHIISGNLICPESNRKFPIIDGITNMM